MWHKVFYEYKVNITPGNLYKVKELSYFRMCHIMEEDFIKEGLRRLHNFINDEPAFEWFYIAQMYYSYKKYIYEPLSVRNNLIKYS